MYVGKHEHYPWPCVMAILACAAIFLWSSTSQADPKPVPELINYQGRVFLESGASDVTGSYDLEFRLYHESAGNAPPLWGELHRGVQVARGNFNVLLGAGTAIQSVPHEAGVMAETFRADAVYVSLNVQGQAPIRVRQQFSSAPHAYSAQNAFTATHGVPPGTVMPFAGVGIVPYGWLSCSGQLVSIETYPALHIAIGDAWGRIDNTFRVPNLNGRLPVGVNTSNALSTSRGEERHALTTSEVPAHSHAYQDKKWGSTTPIFGILGNPEAANDGTETDNRTTFSTGSGSAHNNVQPSAVVQYIIKW